MFSNVLLIDKDWKEGKEYSEEEIKNIGQIWMRFSDRVFELDDDPKLRSLLRKKEQQLALEIKIRFLSKERNLLYWFGSQYKIFYEGGREDEFLTGVQKIYRMIKDHDSKIPIKYFGTVVENIKLLDRCIASLKNEHATKFKDIESKTEKAKRNVYAEIASISRRLGIKLDAGTLLTPEMFAYRNMAKDLEKQEQSRNVSQNARDNKQ